MVKIFQIFSGIFVYLNLLLFFELRPQSAVHERVKKNWDLTQEDFNSLLVWLSPDREAAGLKYEQIRGGLIKLFYFRGCSDPETLADETINRVVKNISSLRANFQGDTEAYFQGVAKYVYLEAARPRRFFVPFALHEHDRRIFEEFQTNKAIGEQSTEELTEDEKAKLKVLRRKCLKKCLSQLEPAQCDLILNYYSFPTDTKLEERRKLAEKLKITLNALRVRVYRIKIELAECIDCCQTENSEESL